MEQYQELGFVPTPRQPMVVPTAMGLQQNKNFAV